MDGWQTLVTITSHSVTLSSGIAVPLMLGAGPGLPKSLAIRETWHIPCFNGRETTWCRCMRILCIMQWPALRKVRWMRKSWLAHFSVCGGTAWYWCMWGILILHLLPNLSWNGNFPGIATEGLVSDVSLLCFSFLGCRCEGCLLNAEGKTPFFKCCRFPSRKSDLSPCCIPCCIPCHNCMLNRVSTYHAEWHWSRFLLTSQLLKYHGRTIPEVSFWSQSGSGAHSSMPCCPERVKTWAKFERFDILLQRVWNARWCPLLISREPRKWVYQQMQRAK